MNNLKSNVICFSTLILLAFSLNSSAQKIIKKQLPVAVQSKFSQLSPGVSNEKWGKEGGNYEAEYMVGKVEHTTVLSPLGTLVQTEIDIKPSLLPAPVLAAVKKAYPGSKIDEAAEITDPAGKKSYEAEIKGMDYIYDISGTLIKTVKD